MMFECIDVPMVSNARRLALKICLLKWFERRAFFTIGTRHPTALQDVVEPRKVELGRRWLAQLLQYVLAIEALAKCGTCV